MYLCIVNGPLSNILFVQNWSQNHVASAIPFTGKEKDYETGYHYFGARYYDCEALTGWLSVDPMSDKYPSLSPYNYCAWNPIALADPYGEDLVRITVPKSKGKTQEVIVDSKIADKACAFTYAMFEKYGVVVTSSFRSMSRQSELRAAWERGEGEKYGLKYKPALKSAHSSGFALDFGAVCGLIEKGEVTIDELSKFAEQYGFKYGGKEFSDIPHFYIEEGLYYRDRDEASRLNDVFFNNNGMIPIFQPTTDPSPTFPIMLKDRNLQVQDNIQVVLPIMLPLD